MRGFTTNATALYGKPLDAATTPSPATTATLQWDGTKWVAQPLDTLKGNGASVNTLPSVQATEGRVLGVARAAAAGVLSWMGPVMTGTLAQRPAAGVAGRLYYATDTQVYYIDDGAAWQQVGAAGGVGSITPIYGDGSDGTVTISSNTNLARDMFYDVLTVNNTFTLNTNGFRVFCRTSASIAGTVQPTPNAGSGGTGGAASPSGTLGVGTAGGNGGTGAGTQNGVAGTNVTISLGGVGGSGGGGAGSGNGASAGTVTAPTAAQGTAPRALPQALTGHLIGNGALALLAGGSGGGGGGEPGSQTGGGGGGGGGVLVLAAKQLTVTATGVVRAIGGAGAGGTTNAGGGGGGGGGLVILVYQALANSGSISAPGGAGGGGGGGGAGNGNSGNTGTVIQLVGV